MGGGSAGFAAREPPIVTTCSEDVEGVGAVGVGAAGDRLAQLVVVAGEVEDVLAQALLGGGGEDRGEVDLAAGAVLAAALDGAGGPGQAGGDGVEVDGHVGHALLRVL